jgi:hypothetical protein
MSDLSFRLLTGEIENRTNFAFARDRSHSSSITFLVVNYFYQLRQGRAWSRNYKSPSSSSSPPSPPPSPTRFRIVITFNFQITTNIFLKTHSFHNYMLFSK